MYEWQANSIIDPFGFTQILSIGVFDALQGNPCVASIAGEKNNLFTVTLDGMLLRSTDTGINWQKVRKLPDFVREPISLAYHNSTLIAVFNNRCYRSVNNGLSWNMIPIFSDAVITISNGTTLFVTTKMGMVYQSSNHGISWLTSDESMKNKDIRALSAFGQNIYAATSEGVFFSPNNGLSWKPIIPFRVIKPRFRRSDSCGCHSLDGQETARRGVTIFHPKGNNSNLPSLNITLITAINNMIMVAIQNYGVFISFNNGTSWEQQNDRLIEKDITAMTGDESALFIATPRVGLYRADMPKYVSYQKDVFEVSVTPNPASDIVTFTWQGGKYNTARIQIYDVSGRLVETLKPLHYSFEVHQQIWDIAAIGSGKYFYQFSSDEQMKSGMITIIK